MTSPARGVAGQPAGAPDQIVAARAPRANPPRAQSIAGARHVSSPSRPKRSLSARQPATAPGTVTDRGPACSTGAPRPALAGAGPAASRALTSPLRQTIANASPPMPVDIGSVTP